MSFSDSPSLTHVRSLQQFLPATSLTLIDGLRIQEGFLGISPFLPTVVVDGADRVVGTRTEHANAGENGFALQHIDANRWRIPAQELAGVYRLTASRSDQTIADRLVYFRADVPTAYLPPSDISRWIYEEPSLCISSDAQLAPQRYLTTGGEDSREFSPALDNCLAACAAMGVTRRGISDTELLAIIRKTLRVEDTSLVWAIVRAWSEQGIVDRLTFRHWRTRRYFPIRPHIVCGEVAGRYVATLAGLVPPSFRTKVSCVAATRDVVLRWRHAESEWVPSLLSMEASGLAEITAFARELSVEQIGFLPSDVPPPTMKLEPMSTQPWRDETFFLLDVSKGRFERIISALPITGVSTVLYSDRNRASSQRSRPDYFLVARDGEPLGWSYARAAATTIALHLGGGVRFLPDGDDAVERGPSAELHLPIALARRLAVTSPHPPGPVATNEGWAYRYTFPTGEDRAASLQQLYPTRSSLPSELVARAQWLYRLIAADGPHARISVSEDLRITLMRLQTQEPLDMPPPRSVTRRLFPHLVEIVAAIRRCDV